MSRHAFVTSLLGRFVEVDPQAYLTALDGKADYNDHPWRGEVVALRDEGTHLEFGVHPQHKVVDGRLVPMGRRGVVFAISPWVTLLSEKEAAALNSFETAPSEPT